MAIIEQRKRADGTTAFRVKVRLKGYPPQSETFARKTDAIRWGKITESAIHEGRHFKTVEAKKHTLADLIDRYVATVLPTKPKSVRQQLPQLLWWKKQFGPYLLSAVTPPLIAEGKDRLLAEKTHQGKLRTGSTATRYLAALSHAFAIAVKEWHWVDDNPVLKVSKPKAPKGRERTLSGAELKRLLKACKASYNPRLFGIVVLAVSTGMRVSEILSLRREQIDLRDGRIVLTDTKNSETRSVPLVEQAKKEIAKALKAKRYGSSLVFPTLDKNGQPKQMDIRKAWQSAIRSADIENFRFHDLRHTASTYLAQSGASISELAAILGHKTLQMVRRYTHLTGESTKTVVTKMNKKIFGA